MPSFDGVYSPIPEVQGKGVKFQLVRGSSLTSWAGIIFPTDQRTLPLEHSMSGKAGAAIFDPGKVSVGGIGSTHGAVLVLSATRTVKLAVVVRAQRGSCARRG